ncbi:hypothetical protein AB0G04_34075 [Actinoplanes sp. NPDC023801]|uniref:hypothetical protein n=1 Tax=Actinoplanes sp. NPDC023801 TaxID=3154595 RepID=UPI0033CC0E48
MESQHQPAYYAPPPQQSQWNGKTNGFSIASLSLALLCLGGGFLSIVFGIIGLVQSRRNGDRRGKFYAIAGLTISGLVLAVIVGAIIVAVVRDATDGPDRDTAGAIRGERSISLRELRAGDCVKDLEGQTGRYVDALPCSSPHSSEVVGVFDLPAGAADPATAAEAGCELRFKEYAGQERPVGAPYIVFTARMEEIGFSGDPGVLCFAHQITGTTTGTVKR